MTRISTPAIRAVAAVLLAAGCGLSPRPDPTVFLVLAPGAAALPMPAIARQDLRIGVGPVSLPAYLDRPQFVTRVDATALTVNEFARWAGPLDRLVAQTVGDNLHAYLAPGGIVTYPWSPVDAPQYRVRIRLQQFEVTAADSALVIGQWEILNPDGDVVGGPTVADYRGAAAAGPTGGAFTLSELLARVSADIAGALRSLPGPE